MPTLEDLPGQAWIEHGDGRVRLVEGVERRGVAVAVVQPFEKRQPHERQQRGLDQARERRPRWHPCLRRDLGWAGYRSCAGGGHVQHSIGWASLTGAPGEGGACASWVSGPNCRAIHMTSRQSPAFQPTRL